MRSEQINYGLIVAPPRLDDLRFGGVNGIVRELLAPDGDWQQDFVTREYQSGRYFDTWNCVAESATNDIEVIFTRKIRLGMIHQDDVTWLRDHGYFDSNGYVNFSARAVGALAGTKVGVGNTGFAIKTAIEEHGLIPESAYAFDLQEVDKEINNPRVYYQQPPEHLMELAREFKRRFKVVGESFWTRDIQDVVKYTPPQVYVNAWYINESGRYHNPDNSWNHAVIYARPANNTTIFDTYDPFEKLLANDYNFYASGYAYHVTPQLTHTSMTIKENDVYLLVEGNEQKVALGVSEGLLIANKGQEIYVMLNSAGRNGGKMGNVNVHPVKLSDWNSVPHFDLARNPID